VAQEKRKAKTRATADTKLNALAKAREAEANSYIEGWRSPRAPQAQPASKRFRSSDNGVLERVERIRSAIAESRAVVDDARDRIRDRDWFVAVNGMPADTRTRDALESALADFHSADLENLAAGIDEGGKVDRTTRGELERLAANLKRRIDLALLYGDEATLKRWRDAVYGGDMEGRVLSALAELATQPELLREALRQVSEGLDSSLARETRRVFGDAIRIRLSPIDAPFADLPPEWLAAALESHHTKPNAGEHQPGLRRLLAVICVKCGAFDTPTTDGSVDAIKATQKRLDALLSNAKAKVAEKDSEAQEKLAALLPPPKT
jgi:hypothetical protein